MAERHELVKFDPCTMGDGGHSWREGYDRAVCSCGWRSAPSKNHKALAALWEIHLKREGILPSDQKVA